MLELIKTLCPMRLAPVSPDMEKGVEILCSELPFQVHEYSSGREHNGWIVPDSWWVERAEIRKEGDLIYDGMAHPLGVMGYAKSFKGKVGLTDLKGHLTFRKDWPDAIGYHCDYFYKPWQADWGMSVPYRLYQRLADGEYEVDLRTHHEPGMMKVMEYTIPGASTDTIILNAHTCHAGQANDDLAGVAVGIELMRRLAKRSNRFTYRLVLAPEHLGTVFYLADLPQEEIADFRYGFFLEMLGNNNRLNLQKTFTGTSLLDRAAHHYLRHRRPDHASAKFRKVVGNDETVWEAPGIELPTVSLSRWPYPEYHTEYDNERIIREDMLEDSVEAMLGILNILETDCRLRRKFTGLVALSNPKYDLYFNQADPSIRSTISTEQIKWNYLMDCIVRYFDETMSILDIAERHEIFYEDLYAYLQKFVEKDLVEMIRRPVPVQGESPSDSRPQPEMVR